MTQQRLYIINGAITIRLVPELATEIGLHESMILLQVDYLLSTRGKNHVNYVEPQKVYINDSLRYMQEHFFPFMAVSTIGQTISGMLETKLLDSWQSDDVRDQTRWLALGPACSALHSVVLVDEERKSKSAQPAKTPSEKPKTPSIYEMAVALAEVCKIDLEMNKGRMLREAKSLNSHTPDEVRRYFGPGSPWYTLDWRGKNGAVPTLAQVKSEWLKMSTGPAASSVPARSVKAADGGLNI